MSRARELTIDAPSSGESRREAVSGVDDAPRGADARARDPAAPLRRSGRTVPARDQEPSTFTAILERLVGAIAGAEAAALVDPEGETVDYAGFLSPFDVKVTAAHWQIVLDEVGREAPKLGSVRQLIVRGRSRSYVVRQLDSGYALVVVMHRHAAFAVSERALQEVEARLSAEAGWPARADVAPWSSVAVVTEGRARKGGKNRDEAARAAKKSGPDGRRPASIRVGGAWLKVEVMGALVNLKPGERGYRVRLPTGVEMMLIRERQGRWFADERID